MGRDVFDPLRRAFSDEKFSTQPMCLEPSTISEIAARTHWLHWKIVQGEDADAVYAAAYLIVPSALPSLAQLLAQTFTHFVP